MAAEYRAFSVTIPAGTPKASPSVQSLAMPARIVRAVRVRFPPGPLGVVGFALGSAGVQVLPYNAGAWLIGDGEVLDWTLDDQIDSGAWQAFGYNTGVHDHTVYLTFALDLVQASGPLGGLAAPLSITPG